MKKLFFLLIVNYSLLVSYYSFSQVGWINQSTSFPSNNNHTYSSIFAVSATTCYMATSHLSIPMADSNNYIVFKTTNGGSNWFVASQGNGKFLKTVQFINENTGFAAGGYYYYYPNLEDERGQVILKTTNGGINWTQVYAFMMPTNPSIDFMDLSFVNASTGWACNLMGGILKTTNGGLNWTGQSTPALFKKRAIFFINDQTGWTAGDSGKVAYTANGGTNWNIQNTGITNTLSSVFFTDINTGWICGTGGKILKTTNAGTNWISMNSGTTDSLNSVIFANSNTGWIAGYNKILVSTNGGSNWTLQYSNSVGNLQSVSFFNAQTGWVCGSRTVLGTVTGGSLVAQIGSDIPENYILYQNFPNPFNPITNIKFDLPKSSYVILKIYNIAGQEIEESLNQTMEGGAYEINWDASHLSGGIYFYRIIAGDFVSTKKMLLLK